MTKTLYLFSNKNFIRVCLIAPNGLFMYSDLQLCEKCVWYRKQN